MNLLKKFHLTLVVISVMLSIVSCDNRGKHVEYLSFENFPMTQTLVGDTIDPYLEDVCVLGKVAVIKDGYVFYKYDSDSCLLYFNPDSGEQISFAPKGGGPEEVSGVSGYGQLYDQERSLYVFDPYKFQLYSSDKPKNFKLDLMCSFPEEFSKFSPWQTILLKNGTLVSPRGDNNYGMVCYNPETQKVDEWPLGYDFQDTDHPERDLVSIRRIGYSPANGLLAETYGTLPVIILHNEDGTINKLLQYRQDTSEGESPLDIESVLSIAMTKKHIWLLYGKPLSENHSNIYVYGYDGTPVADLEISPATSIAIDEERRKLIATNPNNEANAIVYKIPDEIKTL